MIYENEARAIEAANEMNKMQGWGQHRAALVAQGWTVRRVSPYSNRDVIAWSNNERDEAFERREARRAALRKMNSFR